MQLGLEVFLKNKKLIQHLKKRKVGLVCHPASVDHNLNHSLDLIQKQLKISAIFSPQHGIKGEKQDNMIETYDSLHSQYKIPVYSLYGKVRRPTSEMMASFDTLLYDLQDLGCRIYTFITTLLYIMEECAKFQKTLIILDRPNPVGRQVEGMSLRKGYESFVGAAPFPMRYGLTAGELALWYKDYFSLDLDLQVIKMKGYSPKKGTGFGWPVQELAWVNPSPNAQTLNMARCYSGTVLLEGTHLSEGRGTTRALEQMGANEIDFSRVISLMQKKRASWLKGTVLRECYFEPTFHKYEKKLCHGFQIHTDGLFYKPELFKPYRIISLTLKTIRELYPEYLIFRDFHYEYVQDKKAFDVINGGPELREWVESPKSKCEDLESILKKDEQSWKRQYTKYFLYH